MGVYDPQIALAVKLITKKGRPVKIVVLRETPGPNSWNAPTTTEELHDAQAVFLSYKLQDLASLRTITGSDVPANSRKVLIAAGTLDITPDLKMLIRAPDQDWDIVTIDTLAPNGEQILYTCRVG